jgi:hypothetical protein
MHEIYNPINLLNKTIEISYHIDDVGETAKVVEIESTDGERVFEIVFDKLPEMDEDEKFIWIDQEPDEIIGDKACFRNIGYMRRFYLTIAKECSNIEETTDNMKTTIKQLSEQLGVDPVYVNGFIQTLIKIGKASIVGKVEKPVGSRGKPSNIYEIAEGIINQ